MARLEVQRLKTRTQFQAVLAGTTVARTAHFAWHSAALNAPLLEQDVSVAQSNATLFDIRDVWLGAMVPKRWARRAVTRNAIKRQIYSVSSEFALALPQAAHVVRLRAGFDRTQFKSATSEALKKAVRDEIALLFSKAAETMPKAAS